MDEIVQAAYELLNIPILIEDIHGTPLSQIGLTEEQQLVIKKIRRNYRILSISIMFCITRG